MQETPTRGWRLIWPILKRASAGYVADRVPQLGAALAFYMTTAVVPLTILVLALSRLVFDQPAARRHIVAEIERLAGLNANELDLKPPTEHLTSFGAWLGFGIFLLGGFGIFLQLQSALNVIWKAPKVSSETVWHALRRQAVSIAMVIATGLIVLVSLVVSAILHWFAISAGKVAGIPPALLETGNFFFSWAIIVFLFAVIFKMLPAVSIRWREVWVGAVVTALLFTVGKTGLGIYLARSRISSVYGAAGSIVALLTWSYYAGQIFFFGAEITHASAELRRQANPVTRPRPPAIKAGSSG